MSLKPRNLIQAAEADLARRARNKRRHELAAQGVDLDGIVEHYAFYAPHVRKAVNARHLLELAIRRPGAAYKSTKKNTQLIYGDVDLLKAAFDLTEANCEPSLKL